MPTETPTAYNRATLDTARAISSLPPRAREDAARAQRALAWARIDAGLNLCQDVSIEDPLRDDWNVFRYWNGYLDAIQFAAGGWSTS